MADDDRMLVAIMNNVRDFGIARDRHWYRIPVAGAHKWVGDRWPPQWLAFYLTKILGCDAYAVNYYCQVLEIREVPRAELFPENEHDEKAERRYYQLMLGSLLRLSEPIASRRFRRVTFIPSTWWKFAVALEINDLFDTSPLEDRLWAEFKRLAINAERQEFVQVKKRFHALDFAVYCVSGKLNIEADGTAYHSDPRSIAKDISRDNELAALGWLSLRFNTHQIREQMAEYCIPTIVDNITELGGVSEAPDRDTAT
jgi:very-short-patch-repair endonuclease